MKMRAWVVLGATFALIAGAGMPVGVAAAAEDDVPARVVKVDDPRITYGPTPWDGLTNSDDRFHYSRFRTTPGWAEIQFTGSAIDWIARRSPTSGVARVLLDGVETERVDRYAAKNEFAKGMLGPASDPSGFGTHTLRIEWTSDANASTATATAKSIHLDSFEILDFSAIEGKPVTVTPPSASEPYAKRSGVTLNWPQVEAANEYYVYRSSSGQPRERVLTVDGYKNTQAFDAGLEFGRTYTYDVTAVSFGGTESQRSQTVVYQQPYLQPRSADVSTCPTPTVVVSNTADANAAIAAATPGTSIRLSDGVYGQLTVSHKHGSASQMISICGSRNAVVQVYPNTVNMNGDIGVRVYNSSFIQVNGFTITNAQKGVELRYTDDSRFYGLRIKNTAQGGMYAQKNSSNNLFAANTISDTGLDETIPSDGKLWFQDGRYGEGIYIGNSQGNNSCTGSCDVDNSDGNIVVWNTITNVTAEGIEAKESSTGGLIYNNTIVFSASHEKSIYAALQVKGDDYLVMKNTVTSGLRFGMRTTTTQIGTRDWGYRNVFADNSITLTGAIEPPELGFFETEIHPSVFGCDNTLTSSSPVPLHPATTVCEK